MNNFYNVQQYYKPVEFFRFSGYSLFYLKSNPQWVFIIMSESTSQNVLMCTNDALLFPLMHLVKLCQKSLLG